MTMRIARYKKCNLYQTCSQLKITKKAAENACNKLYESVCNYVFKVVDERGEPGYDYVKNTLD